MKMHRRDFFACSTALFVSSSLGLGGIGRCSQKTGRSPVAVALAQESRADSAPLDPMADEIYRDLHKRTFQFFWETTNPETGLTPDRWPTLTFCSIAAVGFSLTAYCIGAERGYVSRNDAATRTLNTLRFFWNLPQGDAVQGMSGYKGFFYHFLNFSDGTRYQNVELSSIDTTLFLLGALTAQAYFDGEGATETEIRDLAQKLFDRVDWKFLMRPSGMLGMGWHPEGGFIPSEWTGYNEGCLCYFLGMASSTSPIEPGVWNKWCSTYDLTWGLNHGTETHVGYSSLAVHQLPHIWYDMRGIADPYMREKGIDYFENARRATLAQRAYASANPDKFDGYGPDVWGFAACDGPFDGEQIIGGKKRSFRSYSERGQGTRSMFDDGTIAPTAAISSMPFTPPESLAVLKAFRKKYGADIYGQYGFFDSFNSTFRGDLPSEFGRQTKTAGWVSNDYLGIDQGPILAMMENHASGFVRDRMRKSPIIGRGLKRAGFEPVNSQGDWLKKVQD